MESFSTEVRYCGVSLLIYMSIIAMILFAFSSPNRKGDYHRYLAEFATSAERKDAAENSLVAYKAASDIATNELPPTHPIRLGLALNFSGKSSSLSSVSIIPPNLISNLAQQCTKAFVVERSLVFNIQYKSILFCALELTSQKIIVRDFKHTHGSNMKLSHFKWADTIR